MATKTIVFGNHATGKDARESVIEEFRIEAHRLACFDILVWYYDYESYDGDSYLLLQHKETKELYVNEAGHCSCMGLEDQFQPTKTSAIVEFARIEKAYRMPFKTAGDSSYHQASESDKAGVEAFQKLLKRLASKGGKKAVAQ